MANLRIGTCSWKYDSWRGLVYSDSPTLNHLEEYAQRYETVQIDQWFWSLHGRDRVSLPRREVAQAYRDSVPDGFTFTVKIPNSISLTHFYRKKKDELLMPNPYFLSVDLFQEFLRSIEPLQGCLGPLMFQFEYLNKQKMASQAEFQERFQAFIEQCPRGYPYGLEIRNPDYLNASYFHSLEQNGLAHVFLQGYYMPPIVDVYRTHTSHIKNASVIRLHGPDRQGMEERSSGQWDRILQPRDEELDAIVKMIQNLISSRVDVWLNVNNHYEGSAPLTIQRIRDRLKKTSSR
jgi:uncharacterized protein YecE (DUF72 family)